MPAFIEHFRNIHPSWTGLSVAIVAAVVCLFMRRLLPAGEHRRGRLPILFLLLSVLLRVLAMPIEAAGAATLLTILNLVAVLLLAFGLVGVVGMALFDVFLLRLGVRVPSILRDLIQGVAFIVAIMGVLRQSGVNLLSLVTTSAVLTAVIGLALQDTIANLFSGLALQIDRTLLVGDWVQVGQRVGRVERIAWRSTALWTRDGDYVILPNRSFLQGEVVNFSRPSQLHRAWVRVGFHYRHPPNDVKRMLLEAVRGAPNVLEEPAPDVVPLDFSESAVVYALRYWIVDFTHEVEIEAEVKTRIWYAAQRAGIEIPFPIRTVHMHQVTQDTVSRAEERDFLERLAALSKVDLFGNLEDGDVELLARGMKRVHFACGERIIRQGEPGDSLYLVHGGEVAVSLAVEGAERQVATLKPGQFFGEMSLMTGEPRRATCAARTDVTCYVIDHATFERLIAAKPKVAEDVSVVLSSRQVELDGEREGLSAEAAIRRAAEARTHLLSRIRNFFHLG